jgi:hypothetical protein
VWKNTLVVLAISGLSFDLYVALLVILGMHERLWQVSLWWRSAVLHLSVVIVCCMSIDYDYGNQSCLLYYCPSAGVSIIDHKRSNTVCTILTWSNAPDAPYPLTSSMALPTNHKLPYLWMIPQS